MTTVPQARSRRRLHISTDDELVSELDKIARELHVDRSAVVAIALVTYIKRANDRAGQAQEQFRGASAGPTPPAGRSTLARRPLRIEEGHTC